jgi:hypothetical protein
MDASKRPVVTPHLFCERQNAFRERRVPAAGRPRLHAPLSPSGEGRVIVSAAQDLRRLVNGFQLSQALHAAAALGLSDQLARAPCTAAQLADAVGADPEPLTRLLRALTVAGVYERDDGGRFTNGELGDALRSDAPGSVAGWARLIGRAYYWQAWSGLVDSVRTGENAFAAQRGESIWSYRARHPEEQEIFDAAMTAQSAAVSDAVVEAYDFGRHARLVDVGGGRGGLLAAILARFPHVHGVLFEQPAVADAAAPVLTAAGVADRCERVGGDFFAAVPDGADAYLLKAVIHDWEDREAVAILRSVRRAMPETGVVLLVEQLQDEGPDPLRTALSDLNMLVAPGGRERNRSEYGALLGQAGLRLSDVVPTHSDVFVVVARPTLPPSNGASP